VTVEGRRWRFWKARASHLILGWTFLLQANIWPSLPLIPPLFDWATALYFHPVVKIDHSLRALHPENSAFHHSPFEAARFVEL
jgi:hypothetical protein